MLSVYNPCLRFTAYLPCSQFTIRAHDYNPRSRLTIRAQGLQSALPVYNRCSRFTTRAYGLQSVLRVYNPRSRLTIRAHSLQPVLTAYKGGSPRVVVSTAAFHARVRGSVPGLGGLKETKLFLPHPRVKVSIVGGLRDREVTCSIQTARARISNPVSGGQCHLNHLTILRRFSWPSLAYMCTKVA